MCEIWLTLLGRFYRILCVMASSSNWELYNIKKFDGSNFTLWKAQIKDVLIQKKQIKALRPCKEGEFIDAEWNDLDELVSSTIRLHLAELVYFTIMSSTTIVSLQYGRSYATPMRRRQLQIRST